MQHKNSRQLNEDYLDAESELTRLTGLIKSFDFAYEDFHKFMGNEKEILNEIQTLSKGTEAERSVTMQLDELEHQRQVFNRKFSDGEEYLEEMIQEQRKKRNQLEEDLFQSRKEENACQK